MKLHLYATLRSTLLSALLLTAALPSGLVAQDQGGSPATATPIAAGNTAGGIAGPTDEDWFVFRPTRPGQTTITLMPGSATAAPIRLRAQLLDANANTRRPLLNSRSASIRFDHITTPGATYYIRVWADSAAPNIGGYRLRLLTSDSAPPLTNAIPRADFDNPNDCDLYSFDLAAGGVVNLTARPSTPTSPALAVDLELINAAGSRLDIARGQNAEIQRILPQGGRYYLRVSPGSAGPNTGSYSIKLCSAATAEQVTTAYAGAFPFWQDRDYIRFSVASTRRVRITSTGSPLIEARLYNAAGRQFAISRSTTNQPSLRFDQILNGGTYYLMLKPYFRARVTGPYRVTIAR